MNDADGAVQSRAAITFEHVDVVFGNARAQRRALQALDAGGDRAGIRESTGAVVGVADASLRVADGELCVLMGLSGSGKSSLLRCVNGLNRVSRGVLQVHTDSLGSVDIAAIGRRRLQHVRRHHLAMVFQQFGLLPWASVAENVGFGLRVRGMRRDAIERTVAEKLELVHLADWADKKIHELSGGMQQRVGLARAFATDADILLMDEPFSALDPLIREHLQDELLSLQRELRKTILFVSHDLDEAMKIGDRIVIMDEGRIVQQGSADDIIMRPANDYVRRFLANINPLNALRACSLMREPTAAERERLAGEQARMQPAGDKAATGFGVAAMAPLRELLAEHLQRPADLLAVTDQGRIVGVIDSATLLKTLQ